MSQPYNSVQLDSFIQTFDDQFQSYKFGISIVSDKEKIKMGGLTEEDAESSSSEVIDNDPEDGSDSKEKAEDMKKRRNLELGFEPQKEIIYNKLLPYVGDMDKESTS